MADKPTDAQMDESSLNIVREFLKAIGEDPEREGLLDTPKRVVKSWTQLYQGYQLKDTDILATTFSESCDQMVILKDITFTSMCEHHVLPFIGKAHVGYLPGDKVVGLSKLARLVDMYAKRLQIQEKMTKQIAGSIMEVLKPKGVGVVIEAHHQCMSCRGVNKQHTTMVTSEMLGEFRDNGEVRREFLTLIKG
jgi:GTP cyclohydrolase IA